MKIQSPQLNLFSYADYRVFLKDYYAQAKKETSHFSFRYFAKMAGFSSPNFLKLVMEEKRNLSAEGIEKFSKALKLNPTESRFFRVLVLSNQATTPEEKDFYTRQLFKTKAVKNLKPLGEAHYEYYSQWYHLALRELVLKKDFKNDAAWIASQFNPPLSESEVKQGMERLVKLGLIQKKGKHFIQTDHALSTGDEITSQAVSNYHRKMMELGMEALTRFSKEERDISSLTIGTSKKTAQKIKKLVQDFRKEIISLVNAEDHVEEVVQLNFQLFPLTKNQEGEQS